MSRTDWKNFVTLCSELDDKELDELFNLFLTPAERDDIADRYIILSSLVNENIPHRDIAQKYNVSLAKVSRGSNAIKMAKEYYPKILENLNNKK